MTAPARRAFAAGRANESVLRMTVARTNARAEDPEDPGLRAPRWCEPALCEGWDVARHLAQRIVELEALAGQLGESEHTFRVIAHGVLPDALRCADLLADARKDHEANR